jgi:hypothetical protein
MRVVSRLLWDASVATFNSENVALEAEVESLVDSLIHLELITSITSITNYKHF